MDIEVSIGEIIGSGLSGIKGMALLNSKYVDGHGMVLGQFAGIILGRFIGMAVGTIAGGGVGILLSPVVFAYDYLNSDYQTIDDQIIEIEQSEIPDSINDNIV